MSLLISSWNICPEQCMKSHGGRFEIPQQLGIWRPGWLSNADQRRAHEPHADGGTAFSSCGQFTQWHLPEGRALLAWAMLQPGSSRILQFHLQMERVWTHPGPERWGLSLLGSSWLPLWSVPESGVTICPSHQSPCPAMHGQLTPNYLGFSHRVDVCFWMSSTELLPQAFFHPKHLSRRTRFSSEW